MATTSAKRSKYLSDKDYEKLIAWELDNRNTINRLIEQGDKYDGIIEALQNAVDSPNDPYNDKNDIHVTIPCLGDAEYGELILRVVDQGASLLKEYKTIHDFVYAKKSISPKGDLDIGQNGQGMAQYQKISLTQRMTTRTDEMMYRFFIVPSENEESRISYTTPIDHPILPQYEKEFDMYEGGTMVEWFDAYEDASDIDVRKVVNKARETFGWRLMVASETRIIINRIPIEIPEYLAGHEKDVKFFGRLGVRTITRDGIPKKVNPEVKGFIVEDKKKGSGKIVIHVKGYRICEIESGIDKAGTMYINCDQLHYILTPTRMGFTDDSFIEALKAFCRKEMRILPDIQDDTQKSERKEAKSLKEILSKGLGSYLERFMKHQKIQGIAKTKQQAMIDPNGNDSAGYATATGTTLEPLECELCHHKMYKSKKWMKKCDCKCHIRKPLGPPVDTGTVGENGTVDGRIEQTDDQEISKGFSVKFRDKEGFPFMEVFTETRTLWICKKDRLYDFCIRGVSPKLSAERTAPYMAEVAYNLEHPKAWQEEDYHTFMSNLHNYTLDILESLGKEF